MRRWIAAGMAVVAVIASSGAALSWAQELKAIRTHKANEITITLKNESGQLTKGDNAIVLEFAGPDGKALDVGKASLSTSMAMRGMAPMMAGAPLTPDAEPGRYKGTIAVPMGGTWQVTVNWDGPAGKGSTRLAVPVR